MRILTAGLAVLVAGALGLGSAGCGGDSNATYVLVTVEQGSAPAGVDALDLDLMLNGEADQWAIETDEPLPFPVTVALKLNQGQGTLTVRATAFMSDREVATGTTPVFITRGDVTPVTVTFGVEIQPSDGGMPDAAPANDGAAIDAPLLADRPSIDAPALTTIQRIRAGMVPVGSAVDLGDVVIVGGIQYGNAIRIWVQDEGGGMNHGIQLFCRLPCATLPTAADLARFTQPGVLARVTGTYAPFMPAGAPWLTLEVENPTLTQVAMGRPVVAIDVSADVVDHMRNGMPSVAPYMGSYVRVSSTPAGSVFTPNLTPPLFATQCGAMTGYFGVMFVSPSMANVAVDTSYFHVGGGLMYCNNICVASCVQKAQATDRFTRISGILEQNLNLGMTYLELIATKDTDFVR